MVKPLTFSEKLVGRRLPSVPSYIDTLMASFVKDRATAEFCGRMRPAERWMQPAHRKARRKGWLRYGMSVGKGLDIWYLREAGEPEALAAYDRVVAIETARREWSRDCDAAFATRQASCDQGAGGDGS